MSARSETPPATNPSPAAPGATAAVDTPLRVRENLAAAGRRAAAFEAGRHFHRARVGVCDLAFRPLSHAAGRWNGVATRGLLAAVAAMSSPAEGGVGRDLELWLGRRRDGACSGERWEWLAESQYDLDQMGLGERREFDLIGARNGFVQVYHDAFDAKREEVCGRLHGQLGGIFRLGELVESGALPDAVFTPPTPAGEQAVPAQIVRGFGDREAHRGDRNRLVIAPPRRRRFDLPWPPTWPARVRREWAALGLPEPPEWVWPAPEWVWPATDGRRDDRAGRRTLVTGLAGHAARLFGERYAASLGLRDRLRVVDASAQLVELDGRRIQVERRRPFLILEALVNAPSNQLASDDLQALPGCLEMDVSKELAKLPAGLRGIIASTGGPTAFYHFLLPALPEVEG